MGFTSISKNFLFCLHKCAHVRGMYKFVPYVYYSTEYLWTVFLLYCNLVACGCVPVPGIAHHEYKHSCVTIRVVKL